jgi:hypothetical protein
MENITTYAVPSESGQVLMLDRKSVARILNMSVPWLRSQDRLGLGPSKVRLGRGAGRIRYPLHEFIRWLGEHEEFVPYAPAVNARADQQAALRP